VEAPIVSAAAKCQNRRGKSRNAYLCDKIYRPTHNNPWTLALVCKRSLLTIGAYAWCNN